MKALVSIPGGVEVTHQADPQPEAGEVVVAVHSCGICGSDVHMAAANTARRGGIPGHEFAGTVAAVGSEARGWSVGQRVAVNPLGGCGSCKPCRLEIPIRCPALPNLGLSAPGGFAEYVAVPQSQLYPIPDSMSIEHGSRVEPLAVAMRAVREASPRPSDNALVFGVGPIGLHLILALRAHGAGSIVAVGRSNAARRRAAAMVGADVVLDSREVNVVDYVRQAGIEIAHAYECSGDAQALVVLSQATMVAGTLVAVALGWTRTAFDTRSFVGKGQRMFGSCAYGSRDFAAALESIASNVVDVEPLITERIPLDAAPAAFLRLQNGADVVSVLVQPWR